MGGSVDSILIYHRTDVVHTRPRLMREFHLEGSQADVRQRSVREGYLPLIEFNELPQLQPPISAQLSQDGHPVCPGVPYGLTHSEAGLLQVQPVPAQLNSRAAAAPGSPWNDVLVQRGYPGPPPDREPRACQRNGQIE